MRAFLVSSFKASLLLLGLSTTTLGAQAQELTGREWCQAFGIAESYRVVTNESQENVGFLCAVLPSSTDPTIADRNPPGVADAEDLDDLVCGYGAHAIGFPGDPDEPLWNDFGTLEDVFLYFVGTYVRPYDSGGYDENAPIPLAAPVSGPQDCRRCLDAWVPGATCGAELDPPDPNPAGPAVAQYESLRVLIEAVQAGFLAIQPAQPNYDSNIDFCGGVAKAVDNCSERVRLEALLGNTLAEDTDEIEVSGANSIRHRVRRLIQYLGDGGVILPSALGTQPWNRWGVDDWGAMRVGGHSGGSGYAYYLARNLASLDAPAQSDQTVGHACLLSGPFDTADTFCDDGPCDPPRRIADWYLDGNDYPVNRLRAVVSIWDRSVNSFEFTYDLLGLDAGVHLARIRSDNYCTGPNADCRPGDDDHLPGHPAIVQEESLAWARTLACFAPIDETAAYVQAPMLNLDMDAICSLESPPNRADFLAGNPEALDTESCGELWQCDQCDFWNVQKQGGQQQAPKVCLFDNEAYAAATAGVTPATARFAYENGGAELDPANYCLSLANTVRRATLY
ncbi:MAG: hypothetical protein AAFY88_05815 [Acidobacteriota bacterium]